MSDEQPTERFAYCPGCRGDAPMPTTIGETKVCGCGWHFVLNADKSILGRSPEAGPHPSEDEQVAPVWALGEPLPRDDKQPTITDGRNT